MNRPLIGRGVAAVIGARVLVPPALGEDGPVDCIVSSADFNGDGVVDVLDAAILGAHLGQTEHGAWCESPPDRRYHIGQHRGDANRDGVVDLRDASILSKEFGGPPDPPIPPIPGVNVRSRCDGGLLAVDTRGVNEFVVINSTTVPQGPGLIWWDYSRPATGLEPAFRIRSRPDGFDLIAEYRNDGATARTHGTIRIGGFAFVDGVAHERRFAIEDQEVRLEGSGAHRFYPSGGVYAPVYQVRGTMAARNNPAVKREYTIGISVHYPLLEYRHGVDFWLKRAGDSAYALDIALNSDNDSAQKMDNHPEADIPPGAVRTYTICVRVMAADSFKGDGHANESLYLFQEYRRYFKRLYGDVRYARDPRPVNGYSIAGLAGATAQNWGFNPPQLNLTAPQAGAGAVVRAGDRRAGWDAWIERMQNAEDRGFRRFMLWAPSGAAVNAACEGPVVNYPFQFTSNWSVVARRDAANPILATQADMRRWASVTGREVGVWWGNSVRPVPWGTCDSDKVHLLDPCLEADVAAADVEMGTGPSETGVYTIGARAVGLDAFGLVHPDISYVWLQRLSGRNPSIRFVTEPVCFDVVHTLAPAFIGAYQQNGSGPVECRIRGPHTMADFLNKGHETWAHIFQMPASPDGAGGLWRGNSVPDKLRQIAADAARWGFVPVIAGGPPWEDGPDGSGRPRWVKEPLGPDLTAQTDGYDVTSFEAAPTWETTVPPGLRD